MLRTLNLIKIVIWILILALCCWFLFSAFSGGLSRLGTWFPIFSRENIDRGDFVNEEQLFSAADFDSIKLNTASYNCIVTTHSDSDIRVVRYGDKDRSMQVSTSGGRLSVDSNERAFSGFFFFNWNAIGGSMTVYVPEDWKGSLAVDTASGDIQLDKLPLLSSVSVGTASGEVRAAELLAEGRISISTASGNVSGSILSGSSLSIDTASGDVELREMRVNSFDIDTASGRVTADGATGGGTVDTMSGDVSLDLVSAPASDIKLSTMSGNIRCRAPENANFTAGFSTMSGNMDSDFPASLSGNKGASIQSGSGGYDISFSTMSGNIRFLKGPAA